MGTINVIARRRKDGVIEFGWHGNWIHYKNTGKVIYDWYRSGYMVDYLFSLGQVANLSEPLSETFDVRGADYRTCPIGPRTGRHRQSVRFFRVPTLPRPLIFSIWMDGGITLLPGRCESSSRWS